jgi:hypothetical protein
MFSTKNKFLRRKVENVLKYSPFWHGIFKSKILLSKHMLKLALYYGTLVVKIIVKLCPAFVAFI